MYKLKINDIIYSARKHPNMLSNTKTNSEKNNDTCLIYNLKWFANYELAKTYENIINNKKIYSYTVINETSLLKIEESTKRYFKYYFMKNKKKLFTHFNLLDENYNNIHPYFTMDDNNKAYFEFKFYYSLISYEESINFIKIIFYLLTINKLEKIPLKLILCFIKHYFFKQKLLCNFIFHKNIAFNLCLLLNHKFHGVIFFIDDINYEIILFNPYINLIDS